MPSSQPRRAVLYARLSVTAEESVSIERQLDSCRKYAEAQGWQVVGEFVDDGVSASKNRPEQRKGWQALTAEQFDVVVIWKIDRLARRLKHFWQTYHQLDSQARTLASVTDHLDMSTTIGQIVAGILAGFAQMEAEAISARVSDSRTYLLKQGRVVGGALAYGYTKTENPDGPGYVLAPHPEQHPVLAEMARRVSGGATVHSVMRWLNATGTPTRSGRGEWGYSMVEALLRNPLLAGMVAFNPGVATGDLKPRERGAGVLLGANGLPVVHPHLAVMPVAAWRTMQAELGDRAKPLDRNAGMKSSAAWSGLIWCGQEDDRHKSPGPVRMHRGKTSREIGGYFCPECHQSITNFESILTEEFLRLRGDGVRWQVVQEVHDGGAALLPEIEHRLDELDGLIRSASSRQERADLQRQQADLFDLRDAKRAEPVQVRYESKPVGNFGEDWATAEDDEQRRAILGDAVTRVLVRRRGKGRPTRAQLLERITWEWTDTYRQPETV